MGFRDTFRQGQPGGCMMVLLAALLLVVALVTGCGGYNDSRGRGDAPVGSRDDKPAHVVNMPDHFANVAVKCYGPNGVYESTRDAPPVVVPHDPTCPGGNR